MVKAVIFDMFETLVSLFEGRNYFSENIAADLGVDENVFRQLWHATEIHRTVGQYTLEDVLERTLQVLQIYSPDKVDMIMQKRHECLKDTFSSVPMEVKELLGTLKKRGIAVGLISNCFSDEFEMIQNSELYPMFDAVKLSYEQGVCKPDPAIYYRIMAELGVEPEECIYVGDGGSNELLAAKEVGMKPVQALWFRDKMFEPHIPSPVLEEYEHAEKPLDVLKYI